jgi:hypothetical protein
MKTTGWIARESVYEPANPIPNWIEEMLVSKPGKGNCTFG